ncbi:MAG: zf-TFIIB domain-containing protein [Phormidium sp.]
MKCPACGNELSQKLAGNIIVDACEGGCGGIWFDRFELPKVDNLEEAEGESLLNIKKSPEVEVNPNLRRYCPKCSGIPMRRHYYSIKRQVWLSPKLCDKPDLSTTLHVRQKLWQTLFNGGFARVSVEK